MAIGNKLVIGIDFTGLKNMKSGGKESDDFDSLLVVIECGFLKLFECLPPINHLTLATPFHKCGTLSSPF